MAVDVKLVGAVAIKVRPDAKGFRKETQKQIDDELRKVVGKAKVTASVDTSGLEKESEEAKEKIEKGRKLVMQVGLDYDSVVKAQNQLNQALKPKQEIIVDFANPETITNAIRDLEQMKADSKVEFKYTQDEKGYQAVLDKIAQIRALETEIPISFDTDEDSLLDVERDMKARLAKLVVPQKLSLALEPNRDSLGAAIKKINDALSKIKSVKIDVTMDEESLLAARKELEAELAKTPVEFKVNYNDQDSLKDARKRLTAMLNELQGQNVSVIFDEEHVKQALANINSLIEEEIPKEKKVDIPVHTSGMQVAARELQFLSRSRRVPLHVVVDAKAMAVAEGVLRTLAGINVLQSFGSGIENMISRFDSISLKANSWAAGIGSLTDVIVHLGTAAFNVGDGLFKMIGLLALAPTAFGVLATSLIIFTGVFKDFGAAVNGDEKAIEKLTESGKKAAAQIRVSFQEIRETISQNFWGAAGDAMLRFTESALPAFSRGFANTSTRLGTIFGGILDSFTNLSITGGLDTMFNNLVKMFENAAGGATLLWDALNILGLRGSEFLPRFGTWLTTISEQFNKFITDADKNGDINRWIHEGIEALKDMWYSGKAIIDQFQGIAHAVEDAGGGGLEEFRENMERIAEMMQGEPFRSRLATIFAGARQGASELNVGFKDLADTIGKAAGYTSELLIGLGNLGGIFLSGVASTIGQVKFQSGTLEGLDDLQEGLLKLTPSFEGLGRIIGEMSRIAGEVFKGIAPIINTIVGFLDGALSRLGDNLAGIAPTLTGLINALVTVGTGPLNLAVDILKGILDIFLEMPEPLRIATGAFVLFLALRNQFGSFAKALDGIWTNMTTSVVKGTAAIDTATASLNNNVINGVPTNFRKMADGSIRELNFFGRSVSGTVDDANRDMKKIDNRPVLNAMKGVLAGAKAMGAGLLAAVGGPWGLAIGAAIAGLALLGDSAAKQKSKLDDLVMALDGQTGINAAAEEMIKTQLRTKDSFLWWETDSTADAAEKVGIKLRDLQKAAEGVPESVEAVDAALRKAGENLGPVSKFWDGAVETMRNIREQTGLDFLGFGMDQFESSSSKAREGLRLMRERLADARKEVEETSRQLGIPVNTAAGIIAAVDVLADKASTADQKLRAVNDIIRQMNGDKSGTQGATQARNDSLRTFDEDFKKIVELAKKDGKALPDLFNKTNGEIDTLTGSGSELFTLYDNMASKGRDAALKLALAQKDPIKAQEVYRTELQKTREKLAEPLAIAGIPPEEINRILEQLDLDPAEVEILLSGKSKEQMLIDLKIAQLEANGIFGADPITATVDSDTAKFDVGIAEAEARAKGFSTIESKAKLSADDQPLVDKIAEAFGKGSGFATNIFTSQLDAGLNPLQASINTAGILGGLWAQNTFSALLDGDNHPFVLAEATVRTAGRALDGTVFSPVIDAVGNALGVIGDVLAGLNQIDGTLVSAVIQVGKELLFGDGSANGSINDGTRYDPRFLPKPHYFANGGFENHVAQIGRPGAVPRVWLERETGGEAYLPLSASKRPRSTKILGEVARMFGYQLVRNSESYSTGGLSGPTVPTRNTTSTVNIGHLTTVDMDSAVRKLRQSQRDALALEGITGV